MPYHLAHILATAASNNVPINYHAVPACNPGGSCYFNTAATRGSRFVAADAQGNGALRWRLPWEKAASSPLPGLGMVQVCSPELCTQAADAIAAHCQCDWVLWLGPELYALALITGLLLSWHSCLQLKKLGLGNLWGSGKRVWVCCSPHVNYNLKHGMLILW